MEDCLPTSNRAVDGNYQQLSACLSEMSRAVLFFQDQLQNSKYDNLSLLEGFLDFLSS